jgi:hypothetical protein
VGLGRLRSLGRQRLQASPDVGIVSIADNIPAAVIGTTLSAYRAATGSISVSAGAWPNGTLDTLEYASGDITWDATTGEATVTKTGTYLISACARDTGSLTGGQQSEGAIYTGASTPAATLRCRKVTVMSGSGVTSFGPFSIFIDEMVYLTAGTIVRGGLQTSGGARTIVGDAAGTMTYLKITKLS